MQLNRTQKWFDGHPPLFAYAACLIAYSAKPVGVLLSQVHEHASLRSAARVSPALWARLYRRHRRLGAVLTQSLCQYAVNQGSFSLAEKLIFRYAVEDMLKERPPSQKGSPQLVGKVFREIVRSGRGLLYRHFERLVQAQEADPATPESAAAVLEMEEVAFFVTVVLPCWFEYEEPLLPLFRRARRGDIAAIEKILWLDQHAIHDPRIALHLRDAAAHPDGTRYVRIQGALKGRAPASPSGARVKTWTAGLIALIADLADYGLPRTAIRELYDALAYDLKGLDRDPDLPDDEAFWIAVSREKDFWRPFARQTIAYLLS
jgi:hypothetical protein